MQKTGVKGVYEHKIDEWRKLFDEAVNELNYRIRVTSFRESADNKMSSGEIYILRVVNDSSGGGYFG
ncbi:hypothetical protein AGMMS49532_06760 [Endomicrobiia bacterium]|uniref:hypothetical protein n=1 Tax=Endomicrobium trichonymphae TaxID=1408204 RepID=UPI000323FC45|nr:hypothetical protein [Candidatus Endomicrobium trichonymphae]GHT09274.1 hypothetical protein AGMMS49532_06760 [Endomicrobiia bacterium]